MIGDSRLPEHFWAKVFVEFTSGCWLWVGAVTGTGYGNFAIRRKTVNAHRVAYTALVGPIPGNMELDHLCRVRACCNPTHLECVTHAENVRRGNAAAFHRDKTHCPKGHEYTGSNTRLYCGRRFCRTCDRARPRRP